MNERYGWVRIVTTGVHGELIQWARNEQELTMRWVRDHGGPSLGYQSEVEHLKKDEVRSELLVTWVGLLNVTERFVRGQIPRYADDPAACRGLAADVAPQVMAEQERLAGLDPMERVREVLRMITRTSRQLPRVVLAYVLSLSLPSLDGILLGEIPIQMELVKAVSDLTGVSESFLRTGQGLNESFPLTAELRAAIEEAETAGWAQSDLAALIRRHVSG